MSADIHRHYRLLDLGYYPMLTIGGATIYIDKGDPNRGIIAHPDGRQTTASKCAIDFCWRRAASVGKWWGK